MSYWAATGSHQVVLPQTVDIPMPHGQGFTQNAAAHRDAANAHTVSAPVAEMVYEGNASTRLGPGSIGHPQLCDRPCLYFAKNECANGMDCEYCHMEHPKRASHLDKRHRETLKEMSLEEWGSLVLPIVRLSLQAVDRSLESQAILDGIAAQCGIQIGASRAAVPLRRRNLVMTLRSMTLRALLYTVRRGLGHYGQHVEDSIDVLFKHMRRSVSNDGFLVYKF